MAKFTAIVTAKSTIEASTPKELFEMVTSAMETMEQAAMEYGMPDVEIVNWPPCGCVDCDCKCATLRSDD